MKDLRVECDSINGRVLFQSNGSVLTTITWGLEDGYPGFYIENSPILANAYKSGFYVIDDCAALQFIINIADKIKLDQRLINILYFNSSSEEIELPFFLPPTVEDEVVSVLPIQQIQSHESWNFFIHRLDGYLDVDFIDELGGKGVVEGFLDLLNVELSIFWKTSNYFDDNEERFDE